ncbi:MAG: hypothetical protein RL692_1170 [Planctomycetota bacterium]|jgi:hypothetical protein
MAKLFYTIDEAATRLGKSEADLQAMVESGQLEEFKMHDQVHFKRAVIDQLVDDDAIDLELPLDDDFDLGDPKAPAPPELSLNDASGSAIIDDLKFDDDFAPAAPTTPTAPTAAASPSMGLDLGLDDLDLSDSAKDMPGIPVVPAVSKTPTTQQNNDEPLGLLDSADASAIAPAVKAKSSDDLDLDLDLGLDLDLDLGMEVSKPNKPSAGGIDILGDSRGDSAAAMAASDASGSMAPPPKRKPNSKQIDEDFLDVDSMTGSGSLSLETVGSGSGMLDDSTDSDQSSVGAALLDDGGDDTFGTGASLGGGSGLFAEPTEMDGFDQENSSVPMAASSTGGGMVMMQTERVDSAMSGMGLGLMVGTLVAIILATLVVMGTRMGGGSALAGMITQDLMMWCGGLAIATLVAGGIGFFVGKSIE